MEIASLLLDRYLNISAKEYQLVLILGKSMESDLNNSYCCPPVHQLYNVSEMQGRVL